MQQQAGVIGVESSVVEVGWVDLSGVAGLHACPALPAHIPLPAFIPPAHISW